MKIEQLSENCYRVRKKQNNKTYTVTFDHKPTEAEVITTMANKLNCICSETNIPFEKAALEYCAMKQNVLSPTTYREYTRSIPRYSEYLRLKKINDITQADIQMEVNRLAKTLSPKTVRNYHALISAVMNSFRPGMKITTTLPQKIKKEPYIPSDEEVKALLEYSKTACNGRYYVPLVLATRSLRRSEICALTPADFEGNICTVNKAKVLNDKKEWVIKTTKTENSTRKVPVPQEVVDIINKQGYVYQGFPNDITDFIDGYCKKFDVPHFSVHKLRHYFVSKLSSENIDTETILKLGGYSSDYVMKNVYRHPVNRKVTEAMAKLDFLLD